MPDSASLDLRITEIFYSLQGEARTVGLPTVFVRLTGCPLRCTYCFNREQVDRYIEEGGAKKPGEYLRHYPVARIVDEFA